MEKPKNARSTAFCASCGASLEKEVAFCPKCGRAIVPRAAQTSSEQIIAEIKGSQEIGFGKGEQYDLYFTDSRLVAIRMGSRPIGGGFGVAGMLAERAIKNHLANKKRERMDPLSLDEMLANEKKNYQITYDSIRSLKLVSGLMQKAIEVKYGTDEKKRYALKKDSLDVLKTTLPKQRVLEGKLELPN